MILGDGALDRGAACHRIPDTLPGVGYVLVEGAAEPVRVRFSYLDSAAIRALAGTYAPGAPDPHAPLRNLMTIHGQQPVQPRPGSRADRATRPSAREVLRETAVEFGVCVRPVPMRRVDLDSEVSTEDARGAASSR